MNSDSTPLIGGHVSIAGGVDKAIDNGMSIGATAIQTFASSPRTLQFKEVDDDTVQQYLTKKQASDIRYHVFHGIYLINLAHENSGMVRRAIDSLVAYQTLAAKIQAAGTVFHLGSHKGNGFDSTINGVTQAIVQVLEESPDEPWLLLENAAGHKGTIGQTFEELARIMEAVSGHTETKRLGICVDTQHAFASGYDLRLAEEWERLMAEIDSLIGMDKLRLIHVNDSMPEMGSKKDRHANLGEGNMGKEAFMAMLQLKQIRGLPLILEVPGLDKSGPRKQDVALLRAWYDESNT